MEGAFSIATLRTAAAGLLLTPLACAASPAVAQPGAASWSTSFEAGLPPELFVRFRSANGYAGEPEIEWRDPRPRVVADERTGRPAPNGGRALALEIPERGRVLVHTPCVAAPGEAVLAVWMRAEAPARAVLRLFRSERSGGRAYGPRQTELGAREVVVGTGWSEASLPGRGGGDIYGQIEMRGPGTLLLDGLAIAAGAQPPVPPLEITVSAGGEEGLPGIATSGAPVAVRVSLSRPLARGEVVAARLRDPRGREAPLVPRASHGNALELVARPRLDGPSLIEVELRSGATVRARATHPLLVLPPPLPVPLERAWLGTHTPLDPRHLALAARLGFRWLRLHDASMVAQWITVEPRPGERRFFDAAVDLAIARGFGLLGVLEATPCAASDSPTAPR